MTLIRMTLSRMMAIRVTLSRMTIIRMTLSRMKTNLLCLVIRYLVD